MTTVFEKNYQNWKKIYSYFCGDLLDFRFLIAIKLDKIHSKRVLDIGCSVGVTVNSTKSDSRFGIDINLDSLIKGKKIFPETEFVAASADALPFKENSFDFVISIHTLDTDPLDPDVTIDEISNVIESNGKIFLSGNWYNDRYVSKFTSKTKISGSWIKKLNGDFNIESKWYVRPNPKEMKIRMRRKLLTKFSSFASKSFDMDEWFYKNYKESDSALNMQPYIIQGIRK